MDQLTALLSAVSDPSRRAIISRLSKSSASVTELAEPFDMSLNAVSKHIKVLELAGLVRRKREWRDHIITLNAEPLRRVAAWVHDYERFWNDHLDSFERHFREKKTKENKK
ncbi:MAG TPA: metalloregulator ArsR/SmtB family transcription factor [Planctomycetota bacterium]|nr:metalloregulator ArsR/SmtB family transcription factor [Planctomycetota bacterium]